MTAPEEGSPTNISDNPQGEWLDQAFARFGNAPLREGNRLALLHDGPGTYDEWLEEIRRAERWVHLDNYIFRSDKIGRRFAEVLSERAAAGVSVRVLFDWFGSMTTPASFWRGLRRAGVEVRAVNPPEIGAPLKALVRDHRKLLAVDGAYASVGGSCIDDRWLKRSSETGLSCYRDTGVSVRGPAVADLERAFAELWGRTGEPLPDEERPGVELMAPRGEGAVRVISQRPGKMRISRVLELATAGVRRRLWIADAYFVSVPVINRALIEAARDGVDVRLLLPATNDAPPVGMLSRLDYRQLLEAGIRIFEYESLMMHAKTLVADGWWTRVGTTNLNLAELLTTWEVDLVVEDQRFGARMEEMFEEDLSNAREICLDGAERRPKAHPGRPVRTAERPGLLSPDAGSRGVAKITRMSRGAYGAIQTGGELYKHERAAGAAICAGALGASLLGLRSPRVLAWPLAATGGLLGGLGLLRAARPPRQSTDRIGDDDR